MVLEGFSKILKTKIISALGHPGAEPHWEDSVWAESRECPVHRYAGSVHCEPGDQNVNESANEFMERVS